MPGDLHIIGNKRRACDIEDDDTSDEDEQNQAQFVLYYNLDSSPVRSSLLPIPRMIKIFFRHQESVRKLRPSRISHSHGPPIKRAKYETVIPVF